MFWRFGFHNASSIDNLLDKDDISLEAILDEDELLQECKTQNTRLIDYFQRVDVLQRLLGYVTGQIECEDRGKCKYPYVATEVLCSEIWSIVETCINHSEQLLAPFWETVLDRPPDDMRTQTVMACHFAKINAVFLNKKPAEMLAFIQSQPSVVPRLLTHIESTSFVDLLVRIIQLDEHPSGAGVLEWLSKENLMGRLIDLLSPCHSPDVHTVVSDLIKGIISMAAPSPGAGLTEGLQNGPASNRFARELADRKSVSKLVDYILGEFPQAKEDVQTPTEDSKPANHHLNPEDDDDHEDLELPNADSAISSVVHSISVIIELIRKNNSDYFEPYLFHTLRNRLITLQQHLTSDPEDAKETLERAMREMVDRMGVVHLGPVLEIMCERLDEFQRYLEKPRSLNGPVSTTVGTITPLTFERYRICELYAELLHCSNMSLLNRPPEFTHLYDSEGRLQGGLPALEELARVIAFGNGDDRDQDAMDEGNDEMEPAMELPVSGASHGSSSIIDSDDDMSDSDDDPGSSDDDAMEEITMSDDPTLLDSQATPPPESPVASSPVLIPSSPKSSFLSPSPETSSPTLSKRNSFTRSDSRPRSSSSRRSLRRQATLDSSTGPSGTPAPPLPIGEKLKQYFLQKNVLSTVLDLFFEYPWNNFLHSVVYDVLHQVLTGHVDDGMNRELTVALFRDAKLMHRIVEGQRRNDIESTNPKGVRLGYMGHLTLISEDVIGALDHYPPDLRIIIARYAPRPDWEEYVNGRFKETKKRDTSLLGGGKPTIGAPPARATRWKVDEAETATTAVPPVDPVAAPASGTNGIEEAKSDFRRSTNTRRESSGDFGTTFMDEEEEDSGTGPPQFARYLAQELQSTEHFGSSSSSDASDDEEEEGGWLSHSVQFDLASAHPPSRGLVEPGSLSAPGFEDAFTPSTSFRDHSFEDPFQDDDDTFGPFSDSAAASGSDPFTFSSSFSEEIGHSSFEDFGDFGDFQGGSGDGELTPTAGSWSFTSGSSAASDDEFGGLGLGRGGDGGKDDLEHVSLEEENRTAVHSASSSS
ncbi:hypothetical protein JAAARDRAFT_173829 [Jaapia argillacea MUCL 33604]|uniref:SAPS-domain-containing protein n=1 Tax=Jaapia argillacea MUCL 33604 TaxID=933084 RepID=A0A067Q2M1_9AGAM|nr:hypothetical protein JAAARDRAFT_173829 [Jaapia argillacea MUCL 33604]